MHEHPVNYIENLNGCCKLCLKNIDGQSGYKCGECPLIYCLQCAKKIAFGSKNKSVHSHPLLLKDRGNIRWICAKCRNEYDGIDKTPFYCQICDFTICNECYLK